MFQELIEKYKIPIFILIIGIGLVGMGIILLKSPFLNFQDSKVEILKEDGDSVKDIVVEIAGAVVKPDIYKFPNTTRLDDLIKAAGGLASNADREWVEKNMNRASVLKDGQKIYIPIQNDNYQTDVLSANNIALYQQAPSSNYEGGDERVNINSGSATELEKLPGIGPVYAQKIIEQRPYSNIEELLSKGVVKDSLYQKIKDQVSIY